MAGEQLIRGVQPAAGPAQMQVAAMMQRLRAENEQLRMECISLQMRAKSMVGCLIGILRTHHDGGPVRFPFEELNKIANDQGVNSERIGDDIKVELVTAEQMRRRTAGYIEGTIMIAVPQKPPFKIQLPVEAGMHFEQLDSLTYQGGKSDGTALTIVTGKPKKPREASCSATGEVRFTTDSAGLLVKAVFIVKKVEIPEPELERTECDNDWHKYAHDGDKIIGRACAQCGQSYKLIAEETTA